MALLITASSLLLSACVTPQSAPPAPGQKLTWAEQHVLDVKKYQKLGEDRRQDRPCHLKSCM
jgi:hypothetical protein